MAPIATKAPTDIKHTDQRGLHTCVHMFPMPPQKNIALCWLARLLGSASILGHSPTWISVVVEFPHWLLLLWLANMLIVMSGGALALFGSGKTPFGNGGRHPI